MTLVDNSTSAGGIYTGTKVTMDSSITGTLGEASEH